MPLSDRVGGMILGRACAVRIPLWGHGCTDITLCGVRLPQRRNALGGWPMASLNMAVKALSLA